MGEKCWNKGSFHRMQRHRQEANRRIHPWIYGESGPPWLRSFFLEPSLPAPSSREKASKTLVCTNAGGALIDRLIGDFLLQSERWRRFDSGAKCPRFDFDRIHPLLRIHACSEKTGFSGFPGSQQEVMRSRVMIKISALFRSRNLAKLPPINPALPVTNSCLGTKCMYLLRRMSNFSYL